jgi:hypothetical protein
VVSVEALIKGAAMKTVRGVLVFAVLFITQLSCRQQNIAGDWQAKLKMGPQESRVVLQISKQNGGGWIAKASRMDQGGQSITLDSLILGIQISRVPGIMAKAISKER